MIKLTLISFFLFLPYCVFSQNVVDKEVNTISKRIFLPAIEMGYVYENSKILGGGLLIKTSIEYRSKQNVFYKLNYDVFDTEYKLNNINNFTNIIQGKTAIEDIVMGVGYRVRKSKVRYFLLYQLGVRFYDYPKSEQTNDIIIILQKKNTNTLSRYSLGTEYYINSKSAITLEIFFANVWRKKDFWKTNNNSLGITIGFTTTIF